MLFKQETLTNVATEIMTKAGAPRENARIVAEHLVIANLKGHDSHGVGMVPNYVKAMLDGLIGRGFRWIATLCCRTKVPATDAAGTWDLFIRSNN